MVRWKSRLASGVSSTLGFSQELPLSQLRLRALAALFVITIPIAVLSYSFFSDSEPLVRVVYSFLATVLVSYGVSYRMIFKPLREMITLLSAGEKQFSTLVNNLPGVTFRHLLDDDWNTLFISDKIEGLTGFPATDFIFNRVRSFYNIIHREDRARVAQSIAESIAARRPYSIEYRVICRDGSIRFFEEHGRPVFGETDPLKIKCLDGAIFDVTERQLDKQAQARFQFALESSGDGLWDWDAETGEVFFSKEWKSMLGYNEEDIKGEFKEWESRVHPDDLAKCMELLDKHFTGQASEYHCEHRLRCKDGSYKWILARGKVTERMLSGKPKRVIGCHLDVTDVRENAIKLQNALDQANAATLAKGRFLANMSHEIRTPLNAVIGMTELLMESELNNEQLDLAATVKASSQSLLGIINDVLDFSRIDAGKMSLVQAPFSCREVIHQVEKIFDLSLKQKNISFLAACHQDVPEKVVGDADRLRQIFINLVGNAVKFTPAGGSINLQVSVRNEEARKITLEFMVIDTGIGISPENQQKIFKAFAQADPGITRQYGGSGLGLAISAELVRMMNGEMIVRSAPNVGTTFVFSAIFGRNNELCEYNPGTKFLPIQPLPEKLQILVAEDHPVNQRLIRHILEKAGHNVDIAANGEEAVNFSASKQFDLILMDVQMPVMSGEEALLKIRERESQQTKRTPIVALTAHALSEERERFLKLGMDGYVTKPVNKNLLFEAINEVVQKSKQHSKAH